MRPGGDPVIAAILEQIDVVNRVLKRLRVPEHAHDDLRQETVIAVWKLARFGRIMWREPRRLRPYLHVVSTWLWGGGGVTFMPDPEHSWEVEEVK